jgi:TonB family protein
LTAIAKLRNATMALTVGSQGGSLLFRIQRIMGERPTGYSPSKLSSLLALSVALACLTINISTRMQAQDTPKQIHQSPGVEADTAGAEVTQPIRYPRAAAEKAIQGTVVAQLDVDAQGTVTDARVLSGPPELRSAVLLAVLSWRFKSNGIASTRQVSVEFRVPPLQELDGEQEARVAALEAQVREKLEAYRQSHEQEQKQKRREARLGATVQPLEEQLKRNEAEELEAQVLERQAQQNQIASQLREQMVEMMRRASGKQKMEGRILARIEIAGLNDEQREQLVGRLPVKIGEKLSLETIEGLRSMLRGEHLECELVPLEDNQSVLKIFAEQNHWAAERVSEQLAELNRSISKAESQLGAAGRVLTEQHPDMLDLKSKLNQLRERREVLLKTSHASRSNLPVNDVKDVDRELVQLQVSMLWPHDAAEYASILEEMQRLKFQRQILLQKQDRLFEHFGNTVPNETRDSQSK